MYIKKDADDQKTGGERKKGTGIGKKKKQKKNINK